MAFQAFTTRALCEGRISKLGIDLRIDDDPSVITQVLQDASEPAYRYLGAKYTVAQMAASDIIAYHSTSFAIRGFCRRRNNPVPKVVQQDVDESTEFYKEVKLGIITVTDITGQKAAVPTMKNPNIELEPVIHPVIDKTQSTGTAEGYRQFAPIYTPPALP